MARAFASSLVVILCLGLVACGEKGGGGDGIVGTWTVDLGPLMEAEVVKLQANFQRQVDAAPAEQREMMKNLFPGKDKLMEQVKLQFAALKAVLEFKADHTVTHLSERGPEHKETGDGTWTQSGDKITVTPRTRNGKPVEGSHTKPATFTLKGDTLSTEADSDTPALTFRRA